MRPFALVLALVAVVSLCLGGAPEGAGGGLGCISIEKRLSPRAAGGDGLIDDAAAVATQFGGPGAGALVTLAGGAILAGVRAYNRRGRLNVAWARALEAAPGEARKRAQAEARAAGVHADAEVLACKVEHAGLRELAATATKPTKPATAKPTKPGSPGAGSKQGTKRGK